MKRILVIGCPDSGKSVFSRKLNQQTNIPLVHLDNLYWKADRTTVPKEEFIASLQKILDKNEWIIDGNYGSTMELRLGKCDTVFFFDLPTEVCLDGIRRRMGKARSDIPWVETQTDDEFEDFVRSFNTETRPRIIELLANFSHLDVIRFSSREEADEYIEILKNEQI